MAIGILISLILIAAIALGLEWICAWRGRGPE